MILPRPASSALAPSVFRRQRPGTRALAIILSLLVPSLASGAAITSHAPPEPIEPRRVVTLEFMETEIALALDLPLVGVADKAPYKRWVDVETEGLSGAAGIGGRAEPSLERLIRLRPDLIVGSTWRHAGVAERLGGIAPLLLYGDLPRPDVTDQYTRMRAIVRDLGERTGRGERADTVLRELDERLAAGRARLTQAGYRGAPVVFGQAVPGNDRIRLFTGNSLIVQVMEQLGLVNGWAAPPGDYGYQAVGISDLERLPEGVHLILSAAPDSDRFRELTSNPAWAELGPVRGGRFHRIERELWPFGGPRSAMRLADRLVEALTGRR